MSAVRSIDRRASPTGSLLQWRMQSRGEPHTGDLAGKYTGPYVSLAGRFEALRMPFVRLSGAPAMPMRNSTGGTLVIHEDTGPEGRHGAIALRKVEA